MNTHTGYFGEYRVRVRFVIMPDLLGQFKSPFTNFKP